MHRLKFILLSTFALFLTQQISAQTSFTPKSGFSTTTASADLKELPAQDWSFFVDDENKVYYIDFETIPVNLADIVIKNDDGEVILQDNLYDLPVNTIYEIDTTDYAVGKYHIELRSYTGVIRKDIEVK